jgi:hypothetical protein
VPKQVVQDEDLVHMHFVQGRYTIPRQFVQDKALESYYKQHVRVSGMDPKSLRKLPRTKNSGTGTVFKAGTQLPGSSSRKTGNLSGKSFEYSGTLSRTKYQVIPE